MPPRVCRSGTALTAPDLSVQSRTRKLAPSVRSLSTTPCLHKTNIIKQKMQDFFRTNGSKYEAAPTVPTYMGLNKDQPFPLNPLFRSQPVLSDDMRELIWSRVMERGEPLKVVSADMNVDVRRVAAVVRMKEVEKLWIKEGKKLAIPYAKAVMKMIPKSYFTEGSKDNVPHEPINEVLVHRNTLNQLFLPVSESRHFTREDAARAFHEKMLSADARSPQRELIGMERRVRAEGAKRDASMEAFRAETAAQEEQLAERMRRRNEREERSTTRVSTGRFEFRFRDMKTEDVGPTGRARNAVGWRYGAPHNDRKRGVVKIPTSVP